MFKPRKIRIDTLTLLHVPAALRNHVEHGGELYLVENPDDKLSVMISTHPDPTGRVCTYVGVKQITYGLEAADVETGGRDLGFIEPGADVFYINRNSDDCPVASGEVDGYYLDGSVELTDPILGSMTVDADDVFQTREEALRAYNK